MEGGFYAPKSVADKIINDIQRASVLRDISKNNFNGIDEILDYIKDLQEFYWKLCSNQVPDKWALSMYNKLININFRHMWE